MTKRLVNMLAGEGPVKRREDGGKPTSMSKYLAARIRHVFSFSSSSARVFLVTAPCWPKSRIIRTSLYYPCMEYLEDNHAA